METALWWALVFACCLFLSFGLAAMGEPTALWLWRDILGVQ